MNGSIEKVNARIVSPKHCKPLLPRGVDAIMRCGMEALHPLFGRTGAGPGRGFDKRNIIQPLASETAELPRRRPAFIL